MEESFSRITRHIFNNWTALKLAVEHSMGGPNSKQTAVECMNYIIQYCLYESNIDVDKIQEALEDILDEEFETICEDGSPKEIATILYKFLCLLSDGNAEQCEIEYQKLPTINSNWLIESTTGTQQSIISVGDTSSEEDIENSEEPMEDDGWTEVKVRKENRSESNILNIIL